MTAAAVERAVRARRLPMVGPMVRATMRDVDPKRQTRRVLRVPGNVSFENAVVTTWDEEAAKLRDYKPGVFADDETLRMTLGPRTVGQYLLCNRSDDIGIHRALCPYGQPGDRLRVLETWAVGKCADGFKPVELHPGTWLKDNGGLWYAADDAVPAHPISERGKWRAGRFMPGYLDTWASRITLEITEVRVERVQSISEDDAKAEGVDEYAKSALSADNDDPPVGRFRYLWDSLNKPRGYGWDVNPYVQCISFRRITP